MARRSIMEEFSEETEINLSPMIDCIFILLIFFIVTTVFIEETGVQVSKPEAASAVSMEETENVVLLITETSKIMMDDREVSLGEVQDRVRASLTEAETPVVIKAHEQSDHGTFMWVWDAARGAGAVNLSFNTVN